MKQYWVYMLANSSNNVLYLGRTEQLPTRLQHHRMGVGGAFTARYKTHKLVYAAAFPDAESAAAWEWKLKKWRRAWKNKLIEEQNPTWKDLSSDL